MATGNEKLTPVMYFLARLEQMKRKYVWANNTGRAIYPDFHIRVILGKKCYMESKIVGELLEAKLEYGLKQKKNLSRISKHAKARH